MIISRSATGFYTLLKNLAAVCFRTIANHILFLLRLLICNFKMFFFLLRKGKNTSLHSGIVRCAKYYLFHHANVCSSWILKFTNIRYIIQLQNCSNRSFLLQRFYSISNIPFFIQRFVDHYACLSIYMYSR